MLTAQRLLLGYGHVLNGHLVCPMWTALSFPLYQYQLVAKKSSCDKGLMREPR